MIKNLLQSIRLLADTAQSFRKNCVEGLEANEKRISQLLNESLMLATILNSKLGYDSAYYTTLPTKGDPTNRVYRTYSIRRRCLRKEGTQGRPDVEGGYCPIGHAEP